jgi:hypothetical protein
MTTVTLRQQKLSPLTNQEIDDNFSNLNTNKLESVVYPNLTTSNSGWYRVATTNSDGRGTYDLEVYTTGGNHDPSVLKIVAQCNWTGGRVLYAIWDGVFPASSVRVTRSASNSYLEVYFTTSVNTFAVRVNHTGFASDIVSYSGALSTGGDTVAETLALTSRLNVGTAGLTGHLTGTTASFSSYVTMGSLVANDPGSSYYSYTHRLGGSVAVAGNLLVEPNAPVVISRANTGTEAYIGLTIQNSSSSAGIKFVSSARAYEIQSGSDGTFLVYDRTANEYRFTINSSGTLFQGNQANQILHAANYNSYALPLTGGAVSGNVTFGSLLKIGTDNTDWATGNYLRGSTNHLVIGVQSGGTLYANYGNNSGTLRLYGTSLLVNDTYNLLHSGNYTSYSPTLTGTGASGTWSINVTGSATSLNFGNGYTVQMGDWGLRNTTPYGWIQLGPANSSWAHIYADRTFYFNQELYVNNNQVLHANNYTSYTLPIGGSWYGSGLPGSRWGGFNVNGGEIAFGRDLPNNGQMGILIDGCYIAGENNGFWSLASDNTWGSRRGMYWDGSYLNFTTNTPTVKATKTLQDELVVSNRTDFGVKRSYYIGNLTASGTQARRFEIARVYIDYNDWHTAGVIQVELHNNYFTGGDYQLWNISYDYNNVSCTLIAGDSPRGRYADVKCSSPVQISGDYYYISIYVDVKYYAYYYAYIHTSWSETTAHQAQSGNILVYTAGNVGITNISDFTPSSTIATSNIIQSYSSLRAPVFYDSDNTGYYLDPNSTSRVARIVQDERYDATNIGTYGGIFSGDWQNLTNSTGQFNVVQVNNISDGNHSNYPGSVYTYGGVLSWKTANHSFQLYASHTGDLTFKTQWSNDNYSGWRRILHESNYNSFSPTLTGTGASGTWGINITGNAATATRTSSVSGYGHAGTGMYAFYNWGGSNGGASAPSDSSYTVGISVGSNPGDPAYGFQIGRQMWNNGLWVRGYDVGWGSWVRLLDSSNYTSYSPTLTGSGASGTWGINITGNADTVDSLHASAFMRTRGTINDNIDSDWGEGIVTFDPVPSGTPPASNPNIRVLNLGNDYNRRTQVAFIYSDDQTWFRRRTEGGWGSWREYLHSGNYTTYTAARNGSNYLIPENWVQLNGYYGLYSPNNGAHFYPNDADYGSWRINGSRNGWNGIYFDTGSTLMMNSSEVGFHRSGHGWQMWWSGGTGYVNKGNPGGGTQATILDSSNYTSYSPPYSGGTLTGTWYFVANRNTSSDSPALQAYSNNGSGAIMSFHRGGYYAVNFGLDSDNVIRIGGWSASTNRWQLDMSGNGTYAGNVTAYSDERLKKDWKSLSSNFVDQLAQIKSGIFTRTDQSIQQVGVSAQSLQKLLPEAVLTQADGMLSVSYGNAALASAVELAKRIVQQDKRIAQLENLINKLITKEI